MNHPGILLNADLGEGESREHTRRLLDAVDLANLACGVHAGDAATQRFVFAAAGAGVLVGAHPGLPGAFGRADRRVSAAELAGLLDSQVGELARIAAESGTVLHHLKVHGALYHRVEGDAGLAEATARFLAARFPGMCWIGLPGRCAEAAARAAGIRFLREGFLDRGYRPDGSLVPRGADGALLEADAVLARLDRWLDEGTFDAVDGTRFPFAMDTACLHGDTPGAVEVARRVRERLGRS